MVGAVIAVDAGGAAKLGDKDDDRFAPGVTHIGLDLGDSAIERPQQIGQPALDYALVDMSVPAVQGERADPWTVGARQKFRRRTRRVGEVFAYLFDPADLGGRGAIHIRAAVDALGAGDRGKPDALFERPTQRWIGVVVEIEQTHRRLVADRRQPRRHPG